MYSTNNDTSQKSTRRTPFKLQLGQLKFGLSSPDVAWVWPGHSRSLLSAEHVRHDLFTMPRRFEIFSNTSQSS